MAMEKLFETEKSPITDTDRVRLGAELAACDRELIEVKEEKSVSNRAYRVRINKLEEKADALSRQLTDGIVEREFEVVEMPDDARQLITILRADTSELVDTRPMTEGEKAASLRRRQVPLFEADDDEAHDTDRPPPRAARKASSRAKSKSTNGRRA